MSVVDRCLTWAGTNLAPLVLIPLAAGLIWIAVWRVWLPPTVPGGATTRTVTTVNADAATKPTHKVTTVVHATQGAMPSRRSEALALALVFLGAGAAIVAVFHDRISSIDLGKDGIKVVLTPAEQSGATVLVSRLAAGGATPRAYSSGLDRYLRAVASRRPLAAAAELEGAVPVGLTAEQAAELAARIADEVVV